jgi:hypothetical protein
MIEYLPLMLTGLGLAASIIYYANVLQNQNKTRQAQNYMQLHQAHYNKEGLETMFMLHNLEWTDFDNYLEKYSALSGHPDVAAALESQLGYLDGIGTMVKENILDVNTVYNVDGRRILMLWFKFESVVKGFRDPKWGTPDYGENFEYLAGEMIRIRKEKGLPIAFEYLANQLNE